MREKYEQKSRLKKLNRRRNEEEENAQEKMKKKNGTRGRKKHACANVKLQVWKIETLTMKKKKIEQKGKCMSCMLTCGCGSGMRVYVLKLVWSHRGVF